jgi:hypothetical protein
VTLGDPDGQGSPVFVVAGRHPSGVGTRVVAHRVDFPRPVTNQGVGGACNGLATSWSGWLPNLQGVATTLTLSGALPGVAAVVAFSVELSNWMGIPLPLDLGQFGAPGCSLLLSPDVVFGQVTDAQGTASFELVLKSSNPALAGARAYAQWGALQPKNKFGISTSDMLELTLLP